MNFVRIKHKQCALKKWVSKYKKAVEAYLKKEGQSEVLNDFEWEFNLIEDETINAWCMPGGKGQLFIPESCRCARESKELPLLWVTKLPMLLLIMVENE